MIKEYCDKCKKEGGLNHSIIGNVYTLQNTVRLDLCHKCNARLRKMVKKWLKN